MAQYYQIVSNMDDLKRLCPNLSIENIQLVAADDIQYGQQQVILTQDHGLIINENQIPQLVYHPQNQTQFIIQDENIGTENFVSGSQGSQQIFYAQEISADSNQIMQQRQTQQISSDSTIQQLQNQQQTEQRQVITQLQQQQSQSSQILVPQQSSTQQVIMQPQSHLVVHSPNQSSVVLQQPNQIVQLNRSSTPQQANQRQIIYNTNRNVIYSDNNTQQIISQQNQQIQQQQQIQRAAQQQRQIINQQRAVQQVVRQQTTTRVVQQRLQQQVVQIQQPSQAAQQQAQQSMQSQQNQSRVIITPYNQIPQTTMQPRIMTTAGRPRANFSQRSPTVRTPRARQPRNTNPQNLQANVIHRYSTPKVNTPRLATLTQHALGTSTPRAKYTPRSASVSNQRFVSPTPVTTIVEHKKNSPKLATNASCTITHPTISPITLSPPSLVPTTPTFTPTSSSLNAQTPLLTPLASSTLISTPVLTPNCGSSIIRTTLKNNITAKAANQSASSSSSTDFDVDDLENSITAAVVTKPQTLLTNSNTTSYSSISSPSQEGLSDLSNDDASKKIVTTPTGKKMTLEEYKKLQQQQNVLKCSNPRNSNITQITQRPKAPTQPISKIRPDIPTPIATPITETRNSAKMLVILESGEQRLITFTLPRESCTVQELLEQIDVQFSHETNIQCVSNPGANIDYVVTVGMNHDTNPNEIVTAVENSIQDKNQQPTQTPQLPQPLQPTPQASTSVQQPIIQLQTELLAQQSQQLQMSQPQLSVLTQTPQQIFSQSQPQLATPNLPTLLSTYQTPPTSVSVPEKSKSPDTPKEPPPKYIDGFLAVCSACGYSGLDHAKCQRCRRIFPEEPRRTPYGKLVTNASNPRNNLQEREKKTIEIHRKIANELVITKPSISSRGSGRGSGRGRGRGRGRPTEIEPVILTLSSDDEADSQSSQNFSNRVPVIPPPTSISPMPFEPVIPETNDVPLDFVRDNVADVKNSIDKLYTSVITRTIRIGSYKYDPTEKVIFSSKGIRIIAPNCKEKTDNVILDIQAKEVVKVCLHFSKAKSLIFIYVMPSCGQYIRESLDMGSSNKGTGPYFNPVDSSDCFKKIILQIENISEEAKSVIRSIYSVNVLEEISKRDAHELLNRNINMDLVKAENTPTENIRQILIYPQGKGGISINTEDYMCLGTDQYLNDVIIDFFLNYLQLEIMTDEQKYKTHIFSSFFYKRLTTTSTRQRQTEKDVRLTASQKRHGRVKSWTKNVNIFEKDFIIIPINEQSHWFLAIICFPGLTGPVTIEGNIPVKNAITPKKKGEKKQLSLQIGSTTITPVTKKEVDSIYLGDDSLSERDEAEGDDSEMASEDSEDEIDINLQPLKQPCILIFDSLAGASRSRVVATLRDYLTCEYKVKIFENSTRVFNKLNIPGNSVKVPQQNNFTDCGIYLLQYVEHFFKDPIKDYRLPIKQLANWFDAIVVTRKREEISDLLKTLIEKYNKETLQYLPDVSFPTLNGKLVEQEESFSNEQAEFEEDEDMEEDFEEDEDAITGSTDPDTTSDEKHQLTISIPSQNGDRKRIISAHSSTENEPKPKKIHRLSEN